jgi:Kef-type K+ transport system membrane component KefB
MDEAVRSALRTRETALTHAADIGEVVRQAILVLALIIAAAKLGGELMARLGQPTVLGELLMGVVLGNLGLFGVTALEPLKDNATLRLVAEIGAILLLFEVGIESDLADLLAVGWSSLLVAMLGVSASMALGWGVSAMLYPAAGWLTHLFVGGAAAATSIGITARVLKDLGKTNTKEARVILGAAVADDILGLVLLAVASGLVGAATVSSGWASSGDNTVGARQILWIVAKVALFLLAAVIVGRSMPGRVFAYAARLKVPGALLAICMCFCFGLAALAGLAGLAPIIGAFAAGVVLEEAHYQPFLERGERKIEELLFPFTTLIVPVFFVMMGFRVDLRSFASPVVLAFAALITLAAIAGKQLCGLGVLERGVDRLAIGVGMIPRGEVSLIFAGLGSGMAIQGQPVLSRTTFSALVLMVALTTFVTPPLLKLAFARRKPLKG